VYHQFCASVEKAISQGVIRDIEPLDLLMDVGSLVVFSFLMAPIITDFLDLDQSHLTDFVDHRKQEALTLLFQGLRV
ncbi:MAG TPA: hypothetical protein GXZ56_03745, partial [Bacteroidales bacterium]|nr:hypothetical protein [Bacteroidales bacterium]